MNRVAYAMRLDGFRDSRVGLGDAITSGSLFATSAASSNVFDSCSEWDFYFNKDKWMACEAELEASQIQTVPQNAAEAGYPPSVVAVAQQTADQQAAFAPSDVANIANYYGAGQLVTAGSVPWWIWAALAFGAYVVVKEVL